MLRKLPRDAEVTSVKNVLFSFSKFPNPDFDIMYIPDEIVAASV